MTDRRIMLGGGLYLALLLTASQGPMWRWAVASLPFAIVATVVFAIQSIETKRRSSRLVVSGALQGALFGLAAAIALGVMAVISPTRFPEPWFFDEGYCVIRPSRVQIFMAMFMIAMPLAILIGAALGWLAEQLRETYGCCVLVLEVTGWLVGTLCSLEQPEMLTRVWIVSAITTFLLASTVAITDSERHFPAQRTCSHSGPRR